jgi:alkylation response protein AidB-like acyl-CoA dehydrogenase
MPADPLVASARALARSVFAPRAAESDRAAAPPRENLDALAAAGLLGLTVPARLGGREAGAAVVRHVLEEIAAGCGVTAFCAFQHLVACRHLASSGNEALGARVLPALAAGARLATVAFSHLRRSGPPCLRAVPAPGPAGGYLFEGTAPWATGIGLVDDVLLAAVRDDGTSVWAYLPLDRGAALEPSPPIPLLAMSASGTVSLRCQGLFVGPEEIVKLVTPEELSRDTAPAALFFSALSLGATAAAIRVLEQQAARSGEPAIGAAAIRFSAALREARAAVDAQAERPLAPDVEADWLATRAATIALGVRAGHAALAACGGAATAIDHPASRILREAALYTTTAQTTLLRAATLAQLTADLPLV